MGCAASSKGTFGPKSTLNLLELKERDDDQDILEENDFPYMQGRLKAMPKEQMDEIIRKGEPWVDPQFQYGAYCLFMNRKSPHKNSAKSKERWLEFSWKRASEYYGENNFVVFDGIDPGDIIMGSCNDCYAFAALGGMAESTGEEVETGMQGKRIKDSFLTKEINDAGLYAIKFIIDGQPRTVVVDDYFPFVRTGRPNKEGIRTGPEVFAFAKPKFDENEIWVQLIEKAWAKLCGSYEASEMGICGEFFQNFIGVPTEINWTDDFDKDQLGQDKLFRLMSVADGNGWIMTASILKSQKKKLELAKPEERILETVGLKNCHSYSILDVREIQLDNGEMQYLVFARNPTGNYYNKDHEVWRGDWGPKSDKWTPKTRKQLNYWTTEESHEKAKLEAKEELRTSRMERYKQEMKRNPKMIYRTKTFKVKKIKKGAKPGNKKKPKAISEDSFAEDVEEITEDDLNQIEDGIGDSPEERPSLKMLKTKVIKAEKKPNNRNAQELEESEEEVEVEENKVEEKKVEEVNVEEKEEADEPKPKKKGKKKRVINGPEDYDMSKPGDRIKYNIDAADGVVDGKEGGEEEDEWLTDEEPQFEGGKKNKVQVEEKKSLLDKSKEDEGDEEHKESKNTSKLPKFLAISRQKNKKKRRKLFGDDTFDQVEKINDKVGKSLIKQVTRDKRKILEKSGPLEQHHNYQLSNDRGASFWLSLEDFSKYFYIMTICFDKPGYFQNFCQDQVFTYKWGAFEFDYPEQTQDIFFSLFQMNDRFMDENDEDNFDNAPYEYPEMQMILTKVIKMPPMTGANKSDDITGECAYIDGVTSDLYNCMHLKINQLNAGKYIMFYTCAFKPDQLTRRLNTIMYAPIELPLKRISAREFGTTFLDDLERRNFNRQIMFNYKQPKF